MQGPRDNGLQQAALMSMALVGTAALWLERVPEILRQWLQWQAMTFFKGAPTA